MADGRQGRRHRAVDVLVVGGGPAGLSAAIYLARYNRRLAVFDTGHGRSTHHQVNHNYLGFPDGIPTVELRALGRAQLDRYERAVVHHHTVIGLEGDAERGFVARTQEGEWAGRCVILAMGVLDHYPHFHGWESYVGRSMFWCITCDGYENRGRDIVVVGHTDASAGEALQLHSLTDRVRLLTNSAAYEISATFEQRLANAGIEVIHDKIDRAEGADGQLHALLTRDGRKLELEALFSIQGATPESRLADQLGVARNAAGYVLVDSEQKTNVEAVYAAGDLTAVHSHQVTAAVHEGAQAASAANYFLYPPDLKAE